MTIYAQTDKIGFGSKKIIKSQFGLGYYVDSEDFIDIGIKYFDNDMMISVNNALSIGFHYNYITTHDRSRNEKDNFYRVGPIARWDFSQDRAKIRFYMESVLDYGNFVIELNDRVNKRNVYYLGLNFNVDVKLLDNFYCTAGLKVIRQLERGEYGLENYPFVGLAYEFR